MSFGDARAIAGVPMVARNCACSVHASCLCPHDQTVVSFCAGTGLAFPHESTERDVDAELERITDVKQNAKGFADYQQWLQGTQLEQTISLREYSVSNRGLRSGLTGTPSQVQDQIGRVEEAGVDLLLLQFSPQAEEMERFSQQVIAPLRPRVAAPGAEAPRS